MPSSVINSKLRERIVTSLSHQGFYVNGHVTPGLFNKVQFKKVQEYSRAEQISLQAKYLKRQMPKIEKYLINGWDVNPHEIELELRIVEDGSIEEIIYRWWNMFWWSVPYQKPYGRQIRLLVWDKAHNAPFGLIGLQSPILRMAVRDNYLQIPKAELDYWINKSMQAQRLGALPPYNQLLGGKMVAAALTSNELRKIYQQKYSNRKTIIKKRKIDSNLLFITTTSAFGRSSVYNRLKYEKEAVAISLGYTKGSGTFHIPQELYGEIQAFLRKREIDTSTTFGCGPSRKVRLLDTALSLLNLRNYHYHNIPREFFLFPMVNNVCDVIQKGDEPIYYDRPFHALTNFWKKRWALPRFDRGNGWIDFDAEAFFQKAKKEIDNGRKQ